MKEYKNKKKVPNCGKAQKENYYCSVCGREISEEEYEDYYGMCWECWDDQLTEESEDMFGDVM